MIAAHAALRYQVAIMLQHVQAVVVNNSVQFLPRPGLSRGIPDIDGLALEGFRLPMGRHIADQPIANFRIAGVKRTRRGIRAGLRPVHPEAEFQAQVVRAVGKCGQAMGKLLPVGVPVAWTAKPAGVQMEHFQAQSGGIAHHVLSAGFIDAHAAAPAVIHQQGIIGVFPAQRVAQDAADPRSQHITRGVNAAVECTKENDGSLEALAVKQACAEKAPEMGSGRLCRPASSLHVSETSECGR